MQMRGASPGARVVWRRPADGLPAERIPPALPRRAARARGAEPRRGGRRRRAAVDLRALALAPPHRDARAARRTPRRVGRGGVARPAAVWPRPATRRRRAGVAVRRHGHRSCAPGVRSPRVRPPPGRSPRSRSPRARAWARNPTCRCGSGSRRRRSCTSTATSSSATRPTVTSSSFDPLAADGADDDAADAGAAVAAAAPPLDHGAAVGAAAAVAALVFRNTHCGGALPLHASLHLGAPVVAHLPIGATVEGHGAAS